MNATTPNPADAFPEVTRVPFPCHTDDRGSLLPIEFHQLPFVPKRVFTVAGMATGTKRGGHSHRWGQQLLVCLHGRIELFLRRGGRETSVLLLPEEPGVMIGPGVWHSQTYLQENSVLLVITSESYNPDSYVYDPESEA